MREEFAVHQNNAFLICFGKLGTPKLRRTAMLCTQHPQELGLPGYPVQELTWTFQVREDDGAEKSIFVRGHLVQLGFGKPVTQNVAGDLVNIPTHMRKIVVKLPSLFGWRPEACNARTARK